jgi:hypothetical protein
MTPEYSGHPPKFKENLLLSSPSRSGRRRSLLKTVAAAELLAEALKPTGRVDEFLLAGEEWVTLAANIDVNLRPGAAGDKRIAASAMHRAGHVTGVSLLFHDATP